MLKNILLLLTLIFNLSLSAQDTRRYSFTHYNVNNGLSAYHVSEVIQDRQGYMWISTLNGLQRFDGSRFITFRHDKSDINSIPDNQVYQMVIDKRNNLWITTADGSIGIFDTKTFKFKKARVRIKDPNSLTGLRNLIVDSKGNLIYTFIFTEVLFYNYATNEFSPVNTIYKTPPSWKILSVLEEPDAGKYWLSTDSGLAVYNGRTGNVSYWKHNADKESVIDKLGNMPHSANLLIDSKKRIWFQHWPGNSGAPFLYCYDMKNNRIVLDHFNFIPIINKYIEPGSMLEQKDGTIWISGLNMFMKYLEKEKTFQPVTNEIINEQSISYKSVHRLFEDREHNIWVPTNNNGLYVFNPADQLFSSKKHINRISDTQGSGGVLSFVQTGSGDILVSTWGDGVYRYDSLLNLKPLNIKDMPGTYGISTWDMCRLPEKKQIWMGLQPGILVYDEQTNSAKVYNPALLGGKTNRQVQNDKLGNVWIGSHNTGLFKWSPVLAKKNFEDGFTKFKEVPNTLIENINVDSKGFVWVCTVDNGVYKIDPATDKVVDHLYTGGPASKRLINESAAAAFEYNDSIMIIITGGLNIYNTKRNTVSHITSLNGLPSDIVMSITKDKDGFIWMGLFNGICRMNFEKRSFTYYDRNDGILNDNMSLAAVTNLRDGRILFGTADDFITFNPASVKPGKIPLNVTITDFRIVNKRVLVDSLLQLSEVELPPEKNSITIGFSALSYFSWNKLTYYYKMEGIDKDWKKADILNQAVYNYLPPGDYIFKIRAENADGFLSADVTQLKIKVKPPFWQTAWFIGLIAFISLVVLYWIDKFRMERLKESQKMRSSIATSLTKDMSSTLSNINVLSEMAKIKAANDPARTKDYVSQISESSNRMIEVMDDMVWSINPENDGMALIIDRMRSYASHVHLRYDIEISFNADEQLNNKRLVMDRRHEFFLIYKEILNNIGKHSRSKFADVSIRCEKSKIIMQIMDDGKGFDTESVIYGRGLNEIRKRASALNAKLDINSKINNGTVIRLEFDVKKESNK